MENGFTNQEVINLTKGLRQIKGYRGISFNRNLIRNLNNAEKEFEIFKKQETEIAEIASDFDKKRDALAIEYADKDPTGNPIVINKEGIKSYKISEASSVEFSKELTTLEDHNKISLDKRESEWKAYEKSLLEANTTFIPVMIEESDIPSDILTEDYKTIYKLINNNK